MQIQTWSTPKLSQRSRLEPRYAKLDLVIDQGQLEQNVTLSTFKGFLEQHDRGCVTQLGFGYLRHQFFSAVPDALRGYHRSVSAGSPQSVTC